MCARFSTYGPSSEAFTVFSSLAELYCSRYLLFQTFQIYTKCITNSTTVVRNPPGLNKILRAANIDTVDETPRHLQFTYISLITYMNTK